jgi:hypothetical protein
MINMENLNELQKIKEIIHIIISLLEDNINNIKNFNAELREEQKELLNFLIGNRENVVSIITKLSNLLIKLNDATNYVEVDSNDEMEDIDFELMEKFLKERREIADNI